LEGIAIAIAKKLCLGSPETSIDLWVACIGNLHVFYSPSLHNSACAYYNPKDLKFCKMRLKLLQNKLSLIFTPQDFKMQGATVSLSGAAS